MRLPAPGPTATAATGAEEVPLGALRQLDIPAHGVAGGDLIRRRCSVHGVLAHRSSSR
jgi:hypothetical protein